MRCPCVGDTESAAVARLVQTQLISWRETAGVRCGSCTLGADNTVTLVKKTGTLQGNYTSYTLLRKKTLRAAS